MVRRILWLVDDDGSPGWLRNEHLLEATGRVGLEHRAITGFDSWRDAVQRIGEVCSQNNGFKDAEHFFICDKMYKTDILGGENLLASTDLKKIVDWKRAVIYSQLRSEDVRDRRLWVGRSVEHSAAEARRICRFLVDGKDDESEITSLMTQLEVLRPLAFLCDAFDGRLPADYGKIFRPMQAYGVPALNSDSDFFFDAVLSSSNMAKKVYAADTAALFSLSSKQVLLRGYRQAKRRYDPLAEESAWESLLTVLGPWTLPERGKLDGASRFIWEIIQTGADASLLIDHPLLHADLSAYERVWLRERFDRIGTEFIGVNDVSVVGELCVGMVHEYESVYELLREAKQGYHELENQR